MQMGRDGKLFLLQSGLLHMVDRNGGTAVQIGREGGGPGEYEMIRNVLLDDEGKLNILDAQLSRITVFDAAGKYLKSTTTQIVGGAGLSAVFWRNREMVVNTKFVDAGMTAPVVIVDADGKVRSFPDTADLSAPTWLQRRVLAVTGAGDLVVIKQYEFEMDVWSPALEKKASILLPVIGSGRPKAPIEPPEDGLYNRKFTPMVLAAWADDSNAQWLWIVSAWPHDNWKPVAPPLPGIRLSTEERLRLAKRDRVVVEVSVVDLAARRVVTTKRFPNMGDMPFGAGLTARSAEDASGEPQIEVSRFRLRR